MIADQSSLIIILKMHLVRSLSLAVLFRSRVCLLSPLNMSRQSLV